MQSNLPPSNPPEKSSNLPSNPAVEPVEQQTIRLLEERLAVDRHRRKIGEVVVRKEIEIHIIEVPIQREKLIVEQISPEYRELATIDLDPEHFSLVSAQNSSAAIANPMREFNSIEAAIQYLRELESQPELATRTIKVQILA